MSRSQKSLWVFGYGSLLWAPGFAFVDSVQGVVRGYARKLWQGNVAHRGTPCQPGRVATLVEDIHEDVWGVAYELCGEDAIAYLNNREVTLGGYVTKFADFYPCKGGRSIPVLMYIATPESVHWLGEAPEDKIADQVLSCRGNSGHNVEYILRLAEYVKEHAPDVFESHLFSLEAHVRRKIAERRLDLNVLMGPSPPAVQPVTVLEEEEAIPLPPLNANDFLELTKLRCLGI